MNIERETIDRLLGLLAEHGPLAFSLRGPLKGVIHGMIQGWVRQVHVRSGHEGVERVFDAVEKAAYERFDEWTASSVCHALDHRFDGIGGWCA